VLSWQVAPAELEALLLTHPHVADCAVSGVETKNGDRPKAYVVLKSEVMSKSSDEDAEEIYQFAKERLAAYKALDGGIQFVSSIPRNAMGKMQKYLL